MPRPRKYIEGETNIMSNENLPSVKFLVIPIALGASGMSGGAVNVREADAVVSEWIEKGYTLFSVIRGEFIPGDRVQIICTLVR